MVCHLVVCPTVVRVTSDGVCVRGVVSVMLFAVIESAIKGVRSVVQAIDLTDLRDSTSRLERHLPAPPLGDQWVISVVLLGEILLEQ